MPFGFIPDSAFGFAGIPTWPPIAWHTATLLADGSVLITGGQAAPVAGAPESVFLSVFLDSAELYDPVTGTFNRTGDMTQSRGFHAAALLLNGKVLIAGKPAGVNAHCGAVRSPDRHLQYRRHLAALDLHAHATE
jgi:hypothetical protein